jgi:hypothetical protein
LEKWLWERCWRVVESAHRAWNKADSLFVIRIWSRRYVTR